MIIIFSVVISMKRKHCIIEMCCRVTLFLNMVELLFNLVMSNCQMQQQRPSCPYWIRRFTWGCDCYDTMTWNVMFIFILMSELRWERVSSQVHVKTNTYTRNNSTIRQKKKKKKKIKKIIYRYYFSIYCYKNIKINRLVFSETKIRIFQINSQSISSWQWTILLIWLWVQFYHHASWAHQNQIRDSYYLWVFMM